MRSSDHLTLKQPFDARDAEEADSLYCRALNVHVPTLQELYNEIQGDVDDTSDGISWWADHLDAQRRILITDHLLAAIHSVQENLADAALSYFEYVDAVDDVSRRMARCILPDGTRNFPSTTCAADLLPHKRESLHAGGIFRAVGSTLDCMAAAIVGVLAIPQNVLKADFRSAVRWLRSETQKSAVRHSVQQAFLATLERLEAAAGPPGWLRWADDYRNMFVHRGRRVSMSLLDVDASIVGPGGAPIPSVTVRPVLLVDPAVSTVESWVQYRKAPMTLTEGAQGSMTELLKSVVFMTNGCAKELVSVWKARRAQPDLLPQPQRQWPEVVTVSSASFPGFNPGAVKVEPDAIVTNATAHRRLATAGIADTPDRVWTDLPTP